MASGINNVPTGGLPDPGRVSVLLLAAGEGVRMGHRPKAWLEAARTTFLQQVSNQVAGYGAQLVAGVRPADLERARALPGLPEGIRLVAGGSSRQATLVRLVSEAEGEFVLIHEVARPRAPAALFERVLTAVTGHAAVIPCLPASSRDAVGVRNGTLLQRVLPRADTVLLQTPQAYRRETLGAMLASARVAGLEASSCAELAMAAGVPVHLVEGAEENLKVTYEEDLAGPGSASGPAPD